jgi:hypothetical protein
MQRNRQTVTTIERIHRTVTHAAVVDAVKDANPHRINLPKLHLVDVLRRHWRNQQQ